MASFPRPDRPFFKTSLFVTDIVMQSRAAPAPSGIVITRKESQLANEFFQHILLWSCWRVRNTLGTGKTAKWGRASLKLTNNVTSCSIHLCRELSEYVNNLAKQFFLAHLYFYHYKAKNWVGCISMLFFCFVFWYTCLVTTFTTKWGGCHKEGSL